MNAQFTPGPWEVRKHEFDGYCVHAPVIERTSGCGYIVVRDVNGDETPCPTYGTPEANARLIAAAPELLEALQGMLSIGDSVTQGQERERREEWVPKARAVIAKAIGETK
jgi:hypothetical protein